MSGADANLFDDNFQITAVDDKKYDRVSRLSGKSMSRDIRIELDINSELLKVQENDTVQLTLASTLALDGSKDDDKGWRETPKDEASLADMYDYVCYGKIYKFEEEGIDKSIKVYVSFGGLLLFIQGPYKKLNTLRIDNVYLLLKR